MDQPQPAVLKISVLKSGEISLDGQPIGLDQLEHALERAKSAGGKVYYYREAAAKDPPPQAMAVLQLIVKHKLAISLSSKPDFSDWVDSKGVSHPRSAAAELHMPEVAASPNIEEVFAKARQAAAGEKEQRGLLILRPDRTYILMPPMAASPQLTKMAAGLERLIPPKPARNIAVISYTEFASEAGAAPALQVVNQSIPFLGMLIALTYIGHTVWVFEGHPSALEAGCRDADVLVVDSGMLPFLNKGWQDQVAAVMRNANILVHDRVKHNLLVVKKLGSNNDQLDFTR